MGIMSKWLRKTKYIFLDIFTSVILSCKIDVFRFTEGFNTLGLLQDISAHSDLFRNLFVEDVEPLKAADLSAVFQVNFSTPGTHKRDRKPDDMLLERLAHWCRRYKKLLLQGLFCKVLYMNLCTHNCRIQIIMTMILSLIVIFRKTRERLGKSEYIALL